MEQPPRYITINGQVCGLGACSKVMREPKTWLRMYIPERNKLAWAGGKSATHTAVGETLLNLDDREIRAWMGDTIEWAMVGSVEDPELDPWDELKRMAVRGSDYIR